MSVLLNISISLVMFVTFLSTVMVMKSDKRFLKTFIAVINTVGLSAVSLGLFISDSNGIYGYHFLILGIAVGLLFISCIVNFIMKKRGESRLLLVFLCFISVIDLIAYIIYIIMTFLYY